MVQGKGKRRSREGGGNRSRVDGIPREGERKVWILQPGLNSRVGGPFAHRVKYTNRDIQRQRQTQNLRETETHKRHRGKEGKT